MFVKFFGEKWGHLIDEYYKYSLVGFLVTGIDFAILIFLIEFFHLYHMYSGAVAFVLAAIVHYFLSINYVFANRNIKSKRVEFSIFFLLGIVGLGLFLAIFYLFTDILGFYYIISKIIATGISFTFNFLSRKYILFR